MAEEKSEVVEKVEAKPEVKAEAKVETPTEEFFLEDFEDEAPEQGAEAATTKEEPKASTLNLNRFKELNPEIDSEDKLYETLKTLNEENPKLKILAKGRKLIEEDKEIQGWKDWQKKSDDDLYVGNLVLQYQRANFTEEAAIEKARAKLAVAKEKNPDSIEESAMFVRGQLSDMIQGRGNELIETLNKASEGIVPDKETTSKLHKQVADKINSIDTFLGLKLAKTPEDMKKIHGKAEKMIANGELSDLLKDPEFISDAIFFRANKKQLEKAISLRGTTKASMLDKLNKAPTVNPPSPIRKFQATEKGGRLGKDFGARMK